MKIGIIVYSHTGNTLSVAEQLEQALIGKGIESELIRLEITGNPSPGAKNITINNPPDLSLYDAYVFAAPVHGFSLAAAMNIYLQGIESISNKKVALITTQHFKKAFLGGNRTINRMTALCQAKGGIVINSAIISWSRADREAQIKACIDKLSDF